jgi:hypothetical protein
MRWREFIAGSAAGRPLVARGQQAAMPIVAIVNGGAADTGAFDAAAFCKGLGQASGGLLQPVPIKPQAR